MLFERREMFRWVLKGVVGEAEGQEVVGLVDRWRVVVKIFKLPSFRFSSPTQVRSFFSIITSIGLKFLHLSPVRFSSQLVEDEFLQTLKNLQTTSNSSVRPVKSPNLTPLSKILSYSTIIDFCQNSDCDEEIRLGVS